MHEVERVGDRAARARGPGRRAGRAAGRCRSRGGDQRDEQHDDEPSTSPRAGARGRVQPPRWPRGSPTAPTPAAQARVRGGPASREAAAHSSMPARNSHRMRKTHTRPPMSWRRMPTSERHHHQPRQRRASAGSRRLDAGRRRAPGPGRAGRPATRPRATTPVRPSWSGPSRAGTTAAPCMPAGSIDQVSWSTGAELQSSWRISRRSPATQIDQHVERPDPGQPEPQESQRRTQLEAPPSWSV